MEGVLKYIVRDVNVDFGCKMAERHLSRVGGEYYIDTIKTHTPLIAYDEKGTYCFTSRIEGVERCEENILMVKVKGAEYMLQKI